MPSIFILDAHPVFREGLRAIFAREDGLEVSGEASDPESALPLLQQSPPDLVVLDPALPDHSGFEIIRLCRNDRIAARFLGLSTFDELLFAQRMIEAGGHGYLLKDRPAADIVAAIHRVLRGDLAFSDRVTMRLLTILQHRSRGGKSNPTSPMDTLSRKEFEVFLRVGQGKNSRQIASELNVGFKTVDTHKLRLRRKLNLASAQELFVAAYEFVRESGTSSQKASTPAPARKARRSRKLETA